MLSYSKIKYGMYPFLQGKLLYGQKAILSRHIMLGVMTTSTVVEEKVFKQYGGCNYGCKIL